MEEIISVGQKLANLGFGILLFLILVGSRLRVWRWQQDFTDLENRHKAELDREREERTNREKYLQDEVNFWKEYGKQSLDVASTQSQVLREKEKKERSPYGRTGG